jgi:hypothetical protein
MRRENNVKTYRIAVVLGALASAELLLCARPAAAEPLWSIVYTPAVPFGGVRDLTSKVTPFGFNVDIRYRFPSNFSLGVSGGWTLFYDKDVATTYPIDNGALTATLYKSTQFLTLSADLLWYYDQSTAIVPYLGVGAGPAWVSFRVAASDLDKQTHPHAFVVIPQAGILWAFDRDDIIRTALVFGVRYTFATTGYDGASTGSFLGLAIGMLAL